MDTKSSNRSLAPFPALRSHPADVLWWTENAGGNHGSCVLCRSGTSSFFAFRGNLNDLQISYLSDASLGLNRV